MRIIEETKAAREYLDPLKTLLEMFPRQEKCWRCEAIIELSSHEETKPYLSDIKYALMWSCPACDIDNWIDINDKVWQEKINLYPRDKFKEIFVLVTGIGIFAYILFMIFIGV